MRAEVKAMFESEYREEDVDASENRRTYENDVQRAVEKKRQKVNVETTRKTERRQEMRREKVKGTEVALEDPVATQTTDSDKASRSKGNYGSNYG